MITKENLIAAKLIDPAIADIWVQPLNKAMDEFGIDSLARQIAFVAQVAHESGNFRYVREIWGATPAQSGYEGRADLGNTQEGDGFRFRGRGLIQITGRSNYRDCGNDLGLDLEEHPEYLETPVNAARSAGWFWKKRRLNTLADTYDHTAMCRRINGGTNGLKERISNYQRLSLVMDQ